jgi:hypothetical protein
MNLFKSTKNKSQKFKKKKYKTQKKSGLKKITFNERGSDLNKNKKKK